MARIAPIRTCRDSRSDHMKASVTRSSASESVLAAASGAPTGASRTVSRNNSASTSGGRPATVKAMRQP
jgi:hypothetical protein